MTLINHNFNNLQQHAAAIKDHLQVEYETVYIIQCHEMDILHKVLNY